MDGRVSAAAPLRYDDAVIRGILDDVKTIAMVGASAKPVRPSYLVFRYLTAKGYRVIPVNPGLAGQTLLGETCYPDLASIPDAIDMIDVFRAAEAVPGILDAALALDPRPRVFWMQLGIRDDATAERARAAGMQVVMDRCPKIEYGRLSREIAWNGVNSRVISAKKPKLGAGYQNFGLNPRR